MSAENDDSDALVPGRGRELASRFDALAKRGFDLISRINEEASRRKKQGEAKRHLDAAWTDFAVGVENALARGVLGYLIDAFDDGARAAAAWLMIELAEDYSPVHVVRTLFDESRLKPTLETKRLIARLESQENHGAEFLMQELIAAEGELRTFIDDLERFLEQVAGLIDPSMATTSYVNALLRWDEIMARQHGHAAATINTVDGSAGVTEVVMPQMGESIAGGIVVRWLKRIGDRIERDEALFKISTDKLDAEIPSPATGIVTEIRVKEGEAIAVHGVVAVIRRV